MIFVSFLTILALCALLLLRRTVPEHLLFAAPDPLRAVTADTPGVTSEVGPLNQQAKTFVHGSKDFTRRRCYIIGTQLI